MSLITSRDHALRVAVWSVIGSEALLFVSLVVMRRAPLTVPSPAAVVLAAAVAAALFASSAAIATAVRRVRGGQQRAATRLVATSGTLALAALAIELATARLWGARDPLAMIVVGLHAAHVGAAIALALWVHALAHAGRIDRRRHDVVSLLGSYLYFVALVWVFVWPMFASARA